MLKGIYITRLVCIACAFLAVSCLVDDSGNSESVIISEDSLSRMDDRSLIYQLLKDTFYLPETCENYEMLKNMHLIQQDAEREDYIFLTYFAGMRAGFNLIYSKGEQTFLIDREIKFPIISDKAKGNLDGIFVDSGQSLNALLEYVNLLDRPVIEDSLFIRDYFSFFYEPCSFLTSKELESEIESNGAKNITFPNSVVGIKFDSQQKQFILIIEFVSYKEEVIRNQPRYFGITYYLFAGNQFVFPRNAGY